LEKAAQKLFIPLGLWWWHQHGMKKRKASFGMQKKPFGSWSVEQ
jgi:hypothetical protein